MSAGIKLKEVTPGTYCFWCPGCECSHWIYTEGQTNWQITGELAAPTVRPSLAHNRSERKAQCHYLITEGTLTYYFDTFHQYRSQSIDMVDWDERVHNPYVTRPRHENNTNRNSHPHTNMVCRFNFNDQG